MKYAIIEACGRQYKISEGDVVFMEKLGVDEGQTVVFDKVLMIGGEASEIGNPYVEGATVEGSVVKNGKSKKIIVYKMRPKKGYRRKQGHRQPYTKVQIEKITV